MSFSCFWKKLIVLCMAMCLVLPTGTVFAKDYYNEIAYPNATVDDLNSNRPEWYTKSLEASVNAKGEQKDDSVVIDIVIDQNNPSVVDVYIFQAQANGNNANVIKDKGENRVAVSTTDLFTEDSIFFNDSKDFYFTTELNYTFSVDGKTLNGELTDVVSDYIAFGVVNNAYVFSFESEALAGMSKEEIIEAILATQAMDNTYDTEVRYRPNIEDQVKEDSMYTPPMLGSTGDSNGSKLEITDSAGPTKKEDEGGLLRSVEEMMSKFVNGIANALNKLVALAIGRRVLIDDLVFNNYGPTIVDYFNDLKGDNYSELIWGTGGSGSGGLAETVSQTYSFFQKIAIIGYLIMLVYMGIRIMLASTGESMSQYKTLFMYWVIGVAILFLYPFVMKYTISLNNAFVEVVERNRGAGLPGTYTIVSDTLPPTSMSAGESLIDVDFETQPFAGDGNDYMSQIANDAINSERLALSIAYLILTWQLIILTVHYYKRLLMIGFLIAIFPITVLFYAVDRIADGKSQAFDKWNKEFMLNVLIQSFHAIVYVFVCGTVYASHNGQGGFDFVLVIVGVTFMFSGEEIIKKIFSQESPTGVSGGLGETAGQIAKTMIAVKAVQAVAKPFAGKDSVFNRVSNAKAAFDNAKSKERAFDAMATAVKPPNAGLRLDHAEDVMNSVDARVSSGAISADEGRRLKAENLTLANAIADLNNPQSRSAEELSRAWDVVEHARQYDPNNALLQDLKLSDAQLADFKDIGKDVAQMVAMGQMDPIVIDRHIKARLGYTLDGMSEADQGKYINMFRTNLAFFGAARYDDPNESAESEVDDGLSALQTMMGSFNFRDYNVDYTDDEYNAISEIGDAADRWAERFYDNDPNESASDEDKDLARLIFRFRNNMSGLYTTEDYFLAANKINELKGSSEVSERMSEALGVDIDILRHSLARQLKKEMLDANPNADTSEIDDVIDSYEDDLRDGVYDDEVSGHELVSLMFEADSDALEARKKQIIDDIADARRESNLDERDIVRDIMTDVLARDHVDISADGFSGNKYFEGQTREDILNEQREAKWNVVKSLAGVNTKETVINSGRPSKEYVKDMESYQRHFEGDNYFNE